MSDQHDDQRVQTGCGASCEAPTADGVYLCKAHTEELVVALRGVPSLAEDLQVTITRQSRMATSNHGSRSAERPLPWNDRASVAHLELKAILAAWCSETAQIWQDTERDPLEAVHWSEPDEMARWLARNLETAKRHDMAGTLYAEICDAITEAKRVVDQPLEPSPFGQCGNELEDGTTCDVFLYGFPNRASVVCGACGTRHSVSERMRWMQDHCHNLHGTPPQLVSWLIVFNINTTAGAIRAMAARDRFPKSDQFGDDDNPMYRLTDVIKAMTTDKGKHRHAQAA